MVLHLLLLAALAGSLALNLQLYRRAKSYYLDLNQTRLDPLGLSDYPPEVNQPKTSRDRLRVVFMGDSRALSWPAPDLKGFEFINRGINGQTTTQIRRRFADHVKPLQPDVVVLQLGVNDLKTVALFPERKAAIIANCQANIGEIVKEARSLGAIVILTTVFPVGEVPLERRPFWSDAVGQAIKETNTYLATLKAEKVIYLDTFPLLANEQGLIRPQYSTDELHLSEQGYQQLNQQLLPLLRSLQR